MSKLMKTIMIQRTSPFPPPPNFFRETLTIRNPVRVSCITIYTTARQNYLVLFLSLTFSFCSSLLSFQFFLFPFFLSLFFFRTGTLTVSFSCIPLSIFLLISLYFSLSWRVFCFGCGCCEEDLQGWVGSG